jgi:hypothetical protein
MSRRIYVLGFEGGTTHLGDNTASDANITVQGTTKRTGNFALRCDGQSGTNSNLQFTVLSSGQGRLFIRLYLYLANIPGTARVIARANGSGASSGRVELRLNSTGTLTIAQNGTAIGTGSTVLTTGQWYRVEIGVNARGDERVSLRVDGNTEVSWITGVAGVDEITAWYVGVLDTVAAALDYYLDDVAFDLETWCGPGGVHALLPSALVTDNANWTANTGTKLAALQTVDDDTAYLLSSATTGSGTDIVFDFDDLPGDVGLPRGSLMWFRSKRDGGSNGVITPLRSGGGFAVATGSTITSTSAYIWDNAFGETDSAATYPFVKGFYDEGGVNELQFGLRNTSANPSRVTAVILEVDCDPTSGAVVDPRRLFASGFERGDFSDFTGASAGSPTVGTGNVRSGTYACQFNPGSLASETVMMLIGVGTETPRGKEISGRVCVYWVTLPNNISWFATVNNTSLSNVDFAVGLDASGNWAIFDDTNASGTVATESAASGPTTGQWYEVEFWYRVSTTGSTATGKAKVWIDGVEVLSITDLQTDSTNLTNNLRLGVYNNKATNTQELWIDDFALDQGQRIPSGHVIDLTPTSVGDFTGTNWTTGAGSGLVTPVNETPSDEDTSYLVGPLGSSFANALSWVLDDLPADTEFVWSVSMSFRIKNDIASGILSAGMSVGGHEPEASSISASASYTWARIFMMTSEWFGMWTPAIFNDSEPILWGFDPTDATRLSNVRVTVEYSEFTIVPIPRRSFVAVSG